MKTVKLPKGKTFEFKSGGRQSSKYPWDAILSGELVQITKGEDYSVETDAMVPKIKSAARRRYKTVKISTRDHEGVKLVDSLIVQAFDMTADERAKEDQRRAQDKIDAAERRANERAATSVPTLAVAAG